MNFHHGSMIVLVPGYTMVQDILSFRDASPHRTQRVSVEPDGQLKVLDWGGRGRPVVFLADYLAANAR